MPQDGGYSVTWAASVVASFEEKHGRASDFWKAVYSISSHHLALYLAKRDPFWEMFKVDCKTVERIHADGCYGDPLVTRRSLINAIIQRQSPDEMRRRLLTRLQNLASLEELEEKQGAGTGGTPPAPAPSLPPDRPEHAWHQAELTFT